MIRLEIKSDFEDAESLIKSAVYSEIKRLETGPRKTDREIKKFEDKYQTSSDIFVREYTAEDLDGGDDEYVRRRTVIFRRFETFFLRIR